MIEPDPDRTNAIAPEPALLPGGALPAPQPLDRKARAARILEILDRYFPTVDIPLDHGDPFQLLVAVILSAQCTDARVNLVTPALFARAPDAREMAELGADQILPYIRSCGLAPGKAKAIAKMSGILSPSTAATSRKTSPPSRSCPASATRRRAW